MSQDAAAHLSPLCRLACLLLTMTLLPGLVAAQAAPSLAAVQIVGDGIPQPLTLQAGDAGRGRAIAASRQSGLCLLCHSAPVPEERFQGDLAPNLSGAGQRWSVAQLRLRLVDPSHFNPDSIMPAYYRNQGLNRVSPAWQARTILSAQQVEDVLAYLLTLRD
ncbi:MAG: sulfur oxidation c-type cytochrome SoxX [Hylemonella sp.]